MTDRGADRASLLASSVRRRIVQHLSELPRIATDDGPTREIGLTAAELGDVLGLHSTTVRFHLDQLVRAGMVATQFVPTGGAGRPAKRYAVVDGELAAGSDVEGPYQVLATLLAEAMATMGAEQLTPEEAGVAWVRRRLARDDGDDEEITRAPARTTGEWLGKVGDVVDLLGEWGYQPDLALEGSHGDVTLTLHDCPFISLARTHPSVVCGVHRGLLQGAVEAAGESQAQVTLRPFVAENTCHAVILRRPPTTDDPQGDPT